MACEEIEKRLRRLQAKLNALEAAGEPLAERRPVIQQIAQATQELRNCRSGRPARSIDDLSNLGPLYEELRRQLGSGQNASIRSLVQATERAKVKLAPLAEMHCRFEWRCYVTEDRGLKCYPEVNCTPPPTHHLFEVELQA